MAREDPGGVSILGDEAGGFISQRVALTLTRTRHACRIGRVNLSADPSVRTMRCGSTTLKSAAVYSGSHNDRSESG